MARKNTRNLTHEKWEERYVSRAKGVRPFYCGNVSDTQALLVELYSCGGLQYEGKGV